MAKGDRVVRLTEKEVDLLRTTIRKHRTELEEAPRVYPNAGPATLEAWKQNARILTGVLLKIGAL